MSPALRHWWRTYATCFNALHIMPIDPTHSTCPFALCLDKGQRQAYGTHNVRCACQSDSGQFVLINVYLCTGLHWASKEHISC